MVRRWAGLLLLLASPALGKDAPPPVLPREVVHPSGAFSFHTPDGWATGPSPTNPRLFQADGDGVVVRFLFEPSEVGFDGLHAICMMEHLDLSTNTEKLTEY